MQAQLRRYRILPTRGEQFATEWRERVVPLREQYGFRVRGWLVEGGDEFVWLLEHDDRESFDAADAAYYASPERGAMQADPARLVADVRNDWVTTIS